MSAPVVECSWATCREHAAFWRREVKRSFGDTLGQFRLLPQLQVGTDLKRNVVLGLGTVAGRDGTQTFQTVLFAELPSAGDRLELRPLVTAQDFGAALESHQPSAEIQMHYERMRGQIGNGVTAFDVDPVNMRVLMTTTSKLYVYKDGLLELLTSWTSLEPLTASFSPLNSDYTAFCSNGKFWIDKNGSKAYESPDDNEGCIYGTPTFVIQEEMERDRGYWWSPSRIEVVVEKVNERRLVGLNFTAPGKVPQTPMKYPRVGAENATSDLVLVSLNKETNEFETKPLLVEIEEVVPYTEYVARVNFDSTGNTIYVTVMDRAQEYMSIILFGRQSFLSEDEAEHLPIAVIHQEETSYWINHNNLTHIPWAPHPEDSMLLIYGSEIRDHCHIYLKSFKNNFVECAEDPITEGPWAVNKDAPLVVDTVRNHVYFLAAYSSVLRTQLCVAKIEKKSDIKTLTPDDMSYKYDRCDSNLAVQPDLGFVCFLSNLTTPPECRFYALLHDTDQALPRAQFRYRLTIQAAPSAADPLPPSQPNSPPIPTYPQSPSAMSVDQQHQPPSPPATIDPHALFSHEFVQVPLECGQVAYALVLQPAGPNARPPYPVIHYVYAGPGLQIVKDCWITVSQFLKYVTLGYAVILVDGRGSANRGLRFEGPIKKKLGQVEIEDQVAVLRELTHTHPNLDSSRVAVTGWSYGGYMALRMLALHPDLYRCACAGGAVVDWRLYDTCYTERYMGTDVDSHYFQSSVISVVDRLPDEAGRLLLIHGLIDENVHFAHTEKLIQYLIQNGKPHQLLLFPNERHGLRKAEAVEYLHANMIMFFHKSLR